MSLPLEGVRVIEVGQALAGPLAGVIMADTVSYTHLTLPTILRV